MSDQITDRQAYVNDPRIACKYGAKCYQKNPVHSEKYKHPPPKRPNKAAPLQAIKKFKPDPQMQVASKEINRESPTDTKPNQSPVKEKKDLAIEDVELPSARKDLGNTSKSFDPKVFIKQKFLVDMPEDFYSFWELCKSLKEKSPQHAFKDVGLTLVGPYDVLAGKFYDVAEQEDDQYLIHWRYYYDPPECQTVLKVDGTSGYHIGYYRDSPKDLPVFLVNNHAENDGVFRVVGDNIFAAVYLYLEDLKKTGDPFKKMLIVKFQTIIKKKAEKLQLSLTDKTQKIIERNKKIVTRTFSKIGIVVPYNRKTQVGYRELSLSNKELKQLLDNIQKALPEQKPKYLSQLQNLMTNVNIATDECDFGAGIELGLDILAHGVDSLNRTIAQVLGINYRLMDREEFAKIVEAHMNNRRRGSDLSII